MRKVESLWIVFENKVLWVFISKSRSYPQGFIRNPILSKLSANSIFE